MRFVFYRGVIIWACVFLLAGHAWAQLTITSAEVWAQGGAGTGAFNFTDGDSSSSVLPETIFPAKKTAAITDATGLSSGSGGGTMNGTLNSNDTSDVWSGTFTGYAEASASSTPELHARGSGSAGMRVRFSFTTGAVRVRVSGTVSFSHNGEQDSRVEASAWREDWTLGETNFPEDVDYAVDLDETLPPGDYSLLLDCASFQFADETRHSIGNASADLAFSLEYEPPDAIEVYWGGGEGTYSVAENWNPSVIPAVFQVAIFDQPDPSTVVFRADEETARAYIRRGLVNFEERAFSLTNGSETDPGFVVGDSPSMPAELYVGVGHELTTVYSNVGRSAGSDGKVVISADGSGAQWHFGELLRIGDNGNGAVEVGADGRLIGKAVVVGRHGNGTLSIDGAGQLLVEEVTVGAGPNSNGQLLLDSSAKGITPTEELEELTVGQSGSGLLTIGDTLSVEELVVARDAGADGHIVVQGALELLYGVIGSEGRGSIEVVDGGSLTVTPAQSVLVLGEAEGSTGILTVSGNGSTLAIPSLALGQAGKGVLAVQDNANVMIGSLALGGLGTGGSTILLDSGGRFESGGINGSFGTGVVGNGTVAAQSGVLALSGRLAPGVFGLAPVLGNPGGSPVVRMSGHGTLMIEGGLSLNLAAYDASIGGTAEGEYDFVEVVGNVSASTVPVTLRFVDGYEPQPGDRIPLISATGSMSFHAVALNYTGLIEGFEYALEVNGSTLEFVALNYGFVAPPPPTDLNGDGQVDATDVQAVILAALGMDGEMAGDVNGDGVVNSVDIQLVILAAMEMS